MPMIDTDKFKVLLDAVAAAEAITEAAHADWQKLDAAQKIKQGAAFAELMGSTERGYFKACVRLTHALTLEIERVEREG